MVKKFCLHHRKSCHLASMYEYYWFLLQLSWRNCIWWNFPEANPFSLGEFNNFSNTHLWPCPTPKCFITKTIQEGCFHGILNEKKYYHRSFPSSFGFKYSVFVGERCIWNFPTRKFIFKFYFVYYFYVHANFSPIDSSNTRWIFSWVRK